MGVLSVLLSMSLKYKLIMMVIIGTFMTISYLIIKTLNPSKPAPVPIQEKTIVYPKKKPSFTEQDPPKIKPKPHKKYKLKKFDIPKDTLKDKIARIKRANSPGYQRPDDNMIMFLKDGVITYRKKRRK